MWWWFAAVAAAVVLYAMVLRESKAEGVGFPAVVGFVLGLVACAVASSSDPEAFSLYVFGAHISLIALGLTALIASALSKSQDGILMAVSGVVTIALVLLVYAGLVGLYMGTLASIGIACVALFLTDIGWISGSGSVKRDFLLVLAVASATLLLWLGVTGAVDELADYQNILDYVSGMAFAVAEAFVCILASRGRSHGKAAVVAIAMTILAGSICVASFLFLRGMMG
jgi:hypothetical protein